MRTAVSRWSDHLAALIGSVEPYFPVIAAVVYFLCNKDFVGLEYNTDEFGYLSKLIFLSGRNIIFPSQWRFGYPLFLLPVVWLTRSPSHFWCNFVLYQSAIWCVTFYLVRIFIRTVRPDYTTVQRFFILLLCAVFPSWCIMAGYAFTTTVIACLYMGLITLFCRWDGKSYFEPMISAVLAGLLYWIHPLSIAVLMSLPVALAIGSRESRKKCAVQILCVFAVLVIFGIANKILGSAITARMSDSISPPSRYPFQWIKDRSVFSFAGMFLGHFSTIGLTTLGAGFCGFSIACHQVLSRFFPRVSAPLPEKTSPAAFLCIFNLVAVAAGTALYFNYLHPYPFYQDYYHWIYCRYLEFFALPVFVLCFLAKWRGAYFLLPCLTFLAAYFGFHGQVSQVQDNTINTISLAVKNVCEYLHLLRGTPKEMVIKHLAFSFGLIFLLSVFARFRKTKIVFGILFLFTCIIGIKYGLVRHERATRTSREYHKFVSALENSKSKNTVTWDTFLHRQKKHINEFEFIHYSYPRAAFWKSKWKFDTTENWLKNKKGILITDFAAPLLPHDDLYIYRTPLRPYKFIVSKAPLAGCESYLQKPYWETERSVDVGEILYLYAHPLRNWVYDPDKTRLFFSADPDKARFLRLKFSRAATADFCLNGKKLTPLSEGYSSDKRFEMYFDVSDKIRQYNELTAVGPDSQSQWACLESAKLENQLSADRHYFTRFSTPCKLYVPGKEPASDDAALTIPAGLTQYGPNVSIPPGTWKVSIRGSNLQQGLFDIRYSHRGRFSCYAVAEAAVSPDHVSYLFSHKQRSGLFEFRCRNKGQAGIRIRCVTLSPVRKSEKTHSRIMVIPFMNDLPFNHLIAFNRDDPYLTCYDFHIAEQDGRWAKKKSSIEFVLPELPKNPIQLIFALRPLGPDQTMLVKTPDGDLLKTFEVVRPGSYVLTLGNEYFRKYGKKVNLNFEFPQARQPGTSDYRILSCYFQTLEVKPLDAQLAPGQTVAFNRADPFRAAGFSHPESWGTWSNAKDCTILFVLPEKRRSETVRLRFQCQAFARMRSVRIYCNDSHAATWEIRQTAARAYDLKLQVPLSRRDVELRFEQFDLASPHEIDPADQDRRQLGMGFISMQYLPETDR